MKIVFIELAPVPGENQIRGSFFDEESNNVVYVDKDHEVTNVYTNKIQQKGIGIIWNFQAADYLKTRGLFVDDLHGAEGRIRKWGTKDIGVLAAEKKFSMQLRETPEELAERKTLLAAREKATRGMSSLEVSSAREKETISLKRIKFKPSATLIVDTKLLQAFFRAIASFVDTTWIAWDATGLWTMGITNDHIVSFDLLIKPADCSVFQPPAEKVVFGVNVYDVVKMLKMIKTATKGKSAIVASENVKLMIDTNKEGKWSLALARIRAQEIGTSIFKLNIKDMRSSEYMKQIQIELDAIKSLRHEHLQKQNAFLQFNKLIGKNIADDIIKNVSPKIDEYLYVEYDPSTKLISIYADNEREESKDEERGSWTPDMILKYPYKPVGSIFSSSYFIKIMKNLIFAQPASILVISMVRSEAMSFFVENLNGSHATFMIAAILKTEPKHEESLP